MSWCLTKQAEAKLLKALRADGNPQRMVDRGDKGRLKWFTEQVGAENAKNLNILFESKMLLKSQQRGLQAFVKNLGGSKQIKTDFLSKVERLDKALSKSEVEQYLGDYASKRLGLEAVTEQQFKTISKLSTEIGELKVKANKDGVFPTKDEAFAHAEKQMQLKEFSDAIKLDAQKISFREQPLRKILHGIGEAPGIMKSAVASLDDSFFGRQGIKTLLDPRTSHIWVKNFAKSFVNIGRELKGKDATRAIDVGILARPNSVNGKYEAGGFGLDVLTEEAFPSPAFRRIPLLGRLYKASETAYNGGAKQMRADLADRMIAMAEKNGLNMLNKNEAQPIGNFISMMTGRGGLGKGEVFAKEANVLLFSIKFLSSNIGTLLAPARYTAGKIGVLPFKSEGAKFASREAAKTTLNVIATVAAISTIAKILDPSSVDSDPRGTNLGKVKVFGHWVDITGGLASIATLAARLTPSVHEGKWGFWYKSSKGNYTDLMAGKYGQMTALDVAENFFEGKLSPAAGIVRDVWRNEVFGGGKPTPEALAKGATTPISIQNFEQLKKDPNTTSLLGSMILEGLGFSVGISSTQKDWSSSTSKKVLQFKEKVGETKFKQANGEYNIQYNNWLNLTRNTTEFKSLSDDDKATVTQNAKDKIQEKVFKQYGFRYKEEKKPASQKRLIKSLEPQ